MAVEQREKIRRKVEQAIIPLPHLDGQIRQYARGLQGGERADFLRSADALTKRALAAAPPYLSGLQPQVHARLKTHARW